MPIPDPTIFRQKTEPLTFGVRYGGYMTKVLLALEAYWENQFAAKQIRESLLYNLWKQCNKWLKLKEEKLQTESTSELSLRRKTEVEWLRDEALFELALTSAATCRALELLEDRKLGGMRVGQNQLKGLDDGYSLERDYYLEQGKQSGSTLSMNKVHGMLSPDRDDTTKQAKLRAKLKQKGFGNLSLSDVYKLEKAFDKPLETVFMNKIERLKYLMAVEDGRFYDIECNPVEFKKGATGNLFMEPFAMDKYGNLFSVPLELKTHKFVEYDSKTKTYDIGTTRQFNHSGILGGADCICAGFVGIGYNCKKGIDEPGVLAAINNNSGHYKPTSEHLKTCLRTLAAQDVNVNFVRVSDFSRPDENGFPTVYWGNDFLAGGRAWPAHDKSSNGFLAVPPIMTT